MDTNWKPSNPKPSENEILDCQRVYFYPEQADINDKHNITGLI